MSDPLAPLRARFLERCREDLPLIAAADPSAPSEDVRLVIHRLAGAGGVFGYPEISALASAVDDQLHDDGPVSPADLAALKAAIEAALA